MGERQIGEMATTSTAVATTVPPQLQDESTEPVAVITLRPKRRERKRVVWTEDTVDNENMNKKKSKCCCIYEKPRKFGESDSEDSEDECEHCFGHVEKKHHKKEKATTSTTQDAPAPEATVETTLRPSPPAPAQPDTNHS